MSLHLRHHQAPSPEWPTVNDLAVDLACTIAERDSWRRVAEAAVTSVGKLHAELDALAAARHQDNREWQAIHAATVQRAEAAELLVQGVSDVWMCAYLTEGRADG